MTEFIIFAMVVAVFCAIVIYQLNVYKNINKDF
ncbi:Uncharacterised protein [Candidatus Ornithobacterium hominis]|uniref:Uncharacterized protein n=1 Tax=Candidatus Ornithobacterium hominis TaxID=2497989 RepID=A0A383TWU6_9FLAO|nr:Uncharacterised protein [Candidatus Ornithobacterium hominis]SZD71940.1 Uncharacterised protein [Candidatus Ornithobacterium hominis]